MLQVNGIRYDTHDMGALMDKCRGLEHLANIEGKLMAICCTDPVHTLALVQYFRQYAGSVLLIHHETPLETAVTMAIEAECDGVVYGELKNYIPLQRSGIKDQEAGICQFSSGTTGNAKLISRTWQQVQTELDAYNHALNAEEQPTPVILTPISHSYGLLSGVLSALDRACEPIVLTSKNPKYALQVIQQTPKHLVYGVPLHLQALSSFPLHNKGFHRMMSSGAPMPQSLYDKLCGMTQIVMQQYGCSEVGCISLAGRMASHTDLGYPLKHLDIAAGSDVSEPSGIHVSIGGRIIATGDVGYLSEEGSLQFIARADDVINVSGLKVYPAEIEETIAKLQGIQEVVVYRGRHPVMGEVVKAQVVSEPFLTADQVRDWCFHTLPPYKVPIQVDCVAQIPKTGTGKVSRRLLEMGDYA